MKPTMTLRDTAIFILLTLIWGASFLWIKLAVREAPPYTIVTLRLLLGLVILLPFLLRRRPGFPRTAKMWSVLIILGMTSTALPWLLITWAEQHIDSAVATVLNGTVPLFTIVFAHLFLHDDRMTARRVAGLLTGFIGAVVLVFDDLRAVGPHTIESHMALLGQGAMLLSAACYGMSNVYARAKLRGVAPVYQAFYTMLCADAVMWMVTPAINPSFHLPVSGMFWLAVGWLGFLGAGVGYLLFYDLLHRIGPTRSAMVTYTIPVVGVTLGVVFLGEALTWPLVVGALLIISGVWSVVRR